jgi:undecaprenyl-diphosphatase
MIEYLIELDKDVFIFLNGFHTPFLDSVMLLISEKLVWLPLYTYLIFLIFKDYSKEAWFVLIGITLTVTLADQITTGLMKPYFARLRPSHEPSLESLIHIVDNYKGSKFGFASSHAANTFGGATFLFLLFRKARKWVVTLFAWAAIVTYSRIYLGVHYPGDIVVGSLVGVLAGIAGYKFYQWLKRLADKRNINSPGIQ